MTCRNFKDFLCLLEAEGELHTLRAVVDPHLEIAAITDRVCKSSDNRALLFEAVRGSRFRVATNLFGSERRLALALGVERLSDLTGWFAAILNAIPGADSAARLANLRLEPRWLAAAPGICEPPSNLHEAVLDLAALPLIKNHPLDGQPDHDGRFITLGGVITTDPGFSEFNCGLYRSAVVTADRLVIKWSRSSGAAAHAASWAATKEPMPVAIALGTAPALTLAATLPLPQTLDEFTFAGLLQGESLKLYRCSNGLPAPVAAEIVIEGYLEPDVCSGSGAFGNHSGYYTPSETAARIRVTAIRHKDDMVLPATVVGKPPMEDCWLARAWGYLLLSLLKIDIPAVTALHQPFAGIFHGAFIVALINGAAEGAGLIAAVRANQWLAGAKLLVIIDAGQDPADEAGVCWQVMNNVSWERDVQISGEKISIDATRKACETRTAVKDDPLVAAMVAKRWKEYGFER